MFLLKLMFYFLLFQFNTGGSKLQIHKYVCRIGSWLCGGRSRRLVDSFFCMLLKISFRNKQSFGWNWSIWKCWIYSIMFFLPWIIYNCVLMKLFSFLSLFLWCQVWTKGNGPRRITGLQPTAVNELWSINKKQQFSKLKKIPNKRQTLAGIWSASGWLCPSKYFAVQFHGHPLNLF